MTSENPDFEKVQIRIPAGHIEVFRQLSHEGKATVSDGIRSALPGGVEGYVMSEEAEERMRRLRQIDRAVEDDYMRDFFWETTYLVNQFRDEAEAHSDDYHINQMEWEDTIDDYLDHYFSRLDILDYQNHSTEIKGEFLAETVDIVNSFGEMADIYGMEDYGEDIREYNEKFFSGERTVPEEFGL